MSAGSRDPELFDPDDESNDLRNDPDYHKWFARLEGESAYEKGIDLVEAMHSRIQSGATPDEVNAFAQGYSIASLKALLVCSGLATKAEFTPQETSH